MTTVRQLRQNGYKVRVLHHRIKRIVAIENNPNGHKKEIIHNLGGSTQIIIDGPDGEHFEGKAICSMVDNYNKKLGVQIALGRAMLNPLNSVNS